MWWWFFNRSQGHSTLIFGILFIYLFYSLFSSSSARISCEKKRKEKYLWSWSSSWSPPVILSRTHTFIPLCFKEKCNRSQKKTKTIDTSSWGYESDSTASTNKDCQSTCRFVNMNHSLDRQTDKSVLNLFEICLKFVWNLFDMDFPQNV